MPESTLKTSSCEDSGVDERESCRAREFDKGCEYSKNRRGTDECRDASFIDEMSHLLDPPLDRADVLVLYHQRDSFSEKEQFLDVDKPCDDSDGGDGISQWIDKTDVLENIDPCCHEQEVEDEYHADKSQGDNQYLLSRMGFCQHQADQHSEYHQVARVESIDDGDDDGEDG